MIDNCSECGSFNLSFTVDVYAEFSMNDFHKINKSTFRKKSTKLWGASWPTNYSIFCSECGKILYSYRKELPRHDLALRVASDEAYRQEIKETGMEPLVIGEGLDWESGEQWKEEWIEYLFREVKENGLRK